MVLLYRFYSLRQELLRKKINLTALVLLGPFQKVLAYNMARDFLLQLINLVSKAILKISFRNKFSLDGSDNHPVNYHKIYHIIE